MLDLITIGNISADLYFSAEELTVKEGRLALAIGGKYRSPMFKMFVGGGGANVAIGAARHRLKTAVVGMVGNTVFRRAIVKRLKKGKVSTKLLLFNQKDINVSTILLSPNGERTIISHQSSHRHVIEEKNIIRRLAHTRAVYFGNMPDVSAVERNKLMSALKQNDVLIFVNIGSSECRKSTKDTNELLENADVLIVNTHEFAELVKKPLEKINFGTSVLGHLPIMKDKLVVVTDGKNGSYGYHKEHVYHVPVGKANVVDTTGVGDAYTSAFISSFVRTEDIAASMKAGTRYAGRILGKIGAN